MSKIGCCAEDNPAGEMASTPCSNRFEVMDELNRHYSERIEKIEKTGYTELLVCNLKKWIEALVTHDKVLIATIESLESEALNRSEKISQLCKERFQVEDICQKYKKELCEKTDIIKDLNCRLKEQAEILNQKECVIKRLNEELDNLRKCLDNIKSKSDGSCENAALNALKCQIESLKRDLGNRENKIKTLEEELCTCKRNLASMQQQPEELNERFLERQKEVERLQKMLNTMEAAGDSKELDLMKKNLEIIKRVSRLESRDMKEALTAEVAEKHDTIMALRRDTAQLEEKARQADMQAIFKDDIIKELRKEVKLARAKESFVEMLGLNEGSRVQMKSKIDSLAAELEERESEILSLEKKLEEMNRHALEGKLGEMSLQLMDRERDMIILCNKVDYIKRYLDKLHEDEDISIKCGLKALLLELNEETEWRRKARRSVTSLGDQPESVIIINRSNSLPAEPSEHVRYNGRVNELELKLERAREEICCLRKKLEAKESELTCLKEKNNSSEDDNKVDKVLMPDSILSMKLEEFQRFTDESGKKLQDTINDIKQHAENLLLKEDMEELDGFLNAEQETFSKANRQLHILLCNIKNTNSGLTTPANHKLQCLENKLKNALETLDRGRSPVCQTEQEESYDERLTNCIKSKIKESLKIVCDLKQDAPQDADSVDPLSSAGSTKLIQEIQEMIKVIQNQSKIQQSRLFAIMDNQKEETGSLTKNFSEVGCLLRSHTKSINYVKDELKIALCNVMQKAEKVRKQVDQITTFECSVKDVSNWINCNLKNNADMVSKVNQLQKNLQQVMSMRNALEDSQKEVNNTCESSDPELNDFEDKCLIARDLCDEVNKELDKAASRINEREQKLTQLSKEVSSFGELICRIQEDIVRIAHALSDNCQEREDFKSYEEAALNIQDTNKQLLQALYNIKLKLIVHHREADGYDIKGIEARKTIAARLKELEEALHDLSDILGEIKASKYMRTTRALSSESVKGLNIQEDEEDNCTETQNTSPESVIQDMRNKICCLNDTISSLEKQNNSYQSTIETLKCQLVKTKEQADETIQNMVSNLQEKCQSMEPIVVSKQTSSESSSIIRKPWVSWMYRQKQNLNKIHEV